MQIKKIVLHLCIIKNENAMKTSEKLKKGIEIEYKNGQGEWVKSIVTKESKVSVWFKGMGYSSLRKITFDNYPELYRIKNNNEN